jgi:DHA2 family multidrug resistance protein-like MFS transporter
VITSLLRRSMTESIPLDGLPMPERVWAVLALSLGVFLSSLDASIANVALPTISRRLSISPVDAIWIVNSYQLGLISCMLASSAIGEIIGYRRLFLSGVTLFTLASLGCALAPTWSVLIAARVIQGMGAACMLGIANALLRYIFPQRMIGRGFGIYAMLASSAASLGPSVATAILSVADWPWLFGVNVPLGFFAVLLGLRTLPFTDRVTRRFDFYGAGLTALSFTMLVLGVDGLAHHAPLWVVISELATALIAGLWLLRVESSLAEPLLPLDLLRIPMFGLSIVVSLSLYGTQFLAYISLPFYFRDVLGLSQAATGLLMTPWPLILALSAPLMGGLADRHSPGLLCGGGLLITSAGLLTLMFVPVHPRVADILWRMIVCGVGWAFVVAPNSRAMLVSAPRLRAGAASGMQAISRVLGQTIGAALAALSFGLFAKSATTVCLVLAVVLGVGAAVVSFRRHHA